mmetsp:Transcript_11816/g.30171  ORF Transcript_11816/g.30171 Transcript_11816/m.30171 type:complete len:275 (-) Transcript_11816:1110-1934(-)
MASRVRTLRRSARIAGTNIAQRTARTSPALKRSLNADEKNEDHKRRKKQTERQSHTAASTSSAKFPTRASEQEMWKKGYKMVAGVDEAGRGPLVGPVVAAACIMGKDVFIKGVQDSKKMTEEQRLEAYDAITSHPQIVYALHAIDVKTIDSINILQAAMKAMEMAVAKLPTKPDYHLIDGNRVPKGLDAGTSKAIIKGDSKSTVIAAASVVAKVERDKLMIQLHEKYPQYGFDKHKGYGVPQHLSALYKYGPCPEHRRTFAPIKHMKLPRNPKS